MDHGPGQLPAHTEANDLVLIAANPRAGAGSPGGTVERLASVLRHYNFRVNVFTDLDAVTTAAERAWQAGELRALVAAGGDGTVAELVNRTPLGLPIAVYPLGTANLLAGYLDISRLAFSLLPACCGTARPSGSMPVRPISAYSC